MTTFVDTSALLAVLDADDRHHRRATQSFEDLLGNEPLVTHNYAVVETAALIQRRMTTTVLRLFFERMLPSLRTIWVDEHTHARAVSALLADRARRISLVDRVSFEVMRGNHIARAFTFDRDFAAEGFETVPRRA